MKCAPQGDISALLVRCGCFRDCFRDIGRVIMRSYLARSCDISNMFFRSAKYDFLYAPNFQGFWCSKSIHLMKRYMHIDIIPMINLWIMRSKIIFNIWHTTKHGIGLCLPCRWILSIFQCGEMIVYANMIYSFCDPIFGWIRWFLALI